MSVDEELETILNGEGLEVTEFDSAPDKVKPVVLRKTVTYIVSAVIFNSKNEVLVVQEAKQDCLKQWYLPAGRMEEGETIEEAMKREVKEEAGFDCQPITLLLVQEQGPQWIRFAFLAEITGGSLKTLKEADAESLQAGWWDQESPLPLRGQDIMRLINAGLKYRQKAWHPTVLPIDLPCHVVVQRLLLAFTSPAKELWLLVSLVGSRGPHLPVAVALKTHTVTWAANVIVQEAMPSSYYQMDIETWGLLSLQHNGRVPGTTDGLCFNLLASLLHSDGPPLDQPPLVESPRYQWYKVDKQPLRDNILERLKDVSLLPVHSLY
ncbi:8-oxo-dGDP phosphatase NUDT18 [Osmerus eperlanus]|uniref:8-oxo-dGDP phosphatase NUDT18 n=1 Tax=Osmerus eperlanus TaxID=29151 RepID=UPI002E0FA33F